ncbi:MAG: hypothetical protein FWE23_06575 [Chitinivibrionia bacterium]|nr:hypothetical protein [Chitinivibrionia bacterium]
MSFYHKNAPKFMAVGFVLIVVGVVFALQLPHLQIYSWIFAGAGLVFYVAGRVGIVLAKNARYEDE